jgi:hypothetical protein
MTAADHGRNPVGTTPTAEQVADVERFRATVAANAPRIARLGGWPDRVSGDSLVARIPNPATGETGLGGFDAGVACALDLIPQNRQRLAATLHAAYTPAAVDQARQEAAALDADSETTWWLAACSVCVEGSVDVAGFCAQVDEFTALANDGTARRAAAQTAFDDMCRSFDVVDGLPIAVRDGGMQGAYLAGFDMAGQYAASYDLWFLGTFRRTLGLEAFTWKSPGDPDAATAEGRQGRSGPVFGSAQFVKCADADEFARARAAARPRD